MNTIKVFLFLSVLQIGYMTCEAQNSPKLNSIALGPMGDIFILQYARQFGNCNEFVAGASYTNPGILNMIKYPGKEQIYTVELGYRKYLLKGLNIEMQIDPQYFMCYEEVERKGYNDFGLTAEMRFGYKFDFKSGFFINIQFFGGYHIINPKPDSFKEVDGSSLYLSPIPMFFLGYKF